MGRVRCDHHPTGQDETESGEGARQSAGMNFVRGRNPSAGMNRKRFCVEEKSGVGIGYRLGGADSHAWENAGMLYGGYPQGITFAAADLL